MFMLKQLKGFSQNRFIAKMLQLKTSSRKSARSYTKRGWRSLWKTIVAFLVGALSLAYLAQPAASNGSPLLGIFYGGSEGLQINQVQALESWQGKKLAVVHIFTNWCDQTTVLNNLFNQQLINIWNNHNVPMITWEPFFCVSSPNPTDAQVRAGTPSNISVRAANGEFDPYLFNWADRMKQFLSGPDGVFNTPDDRRAYIRFAHEMNGDWYPWGAAKGGSSPADYVRMWQRVKSLFYDKGMDVFHVQWVWCPGHYDVGAYSAESFYPGDKYVDWVSISGYNWGASQTWSNWLNPDQVWGDMIRRLRTLTKRPLSITEFASTTATTSGPSVAAKSQWITNAFNYILAQNIKMVVWFNDAKETDWTVFGGPSGDSTFYYNGNTYNTYTAYKTAVGSSNFISSDTSNPRLLTDAQFGGW